MRLMMAIENSLELALARVRPAREPPSKPERNGAVNRPAKSGVFGWKAAPYGLDVRPASA
jgi:hypothetical protein